MSRISRLLLALLATILVVGGLQAPAHAAITWNYIGIAGGTQIKALDTTVSSDLTAQSVIVGTTVPKTHSNSTLAVNAAGLLSTGAIQTKNDAFKTTTGIGVRSYARTAGVDLLNGLIKADALETTMVTRANNDGTTTATGATNFVNLRIVGVELPVNIAKNTTVRIPGIATVSLNRFMTAQVEPGRGSMGWALGVVLLKSQGDLPAGATIVVNPLKQMLVPSVPNQAIFGGYAFSTRILAKVGDTVEVRSDPTALISTPMAGSNGDTLTNTTATANVPGVATLGTLTSTSTSAKDGFGGGTVTTSNETAGLNLLNGLVTADVIKVTASSTRSAGIYSGQMNLKLVNLVVAGNAIPIDVKKNTVIDVAGIGRVYVNQQVQGKQGNLIRAVMVVLSTARAGLPAGATIEVAVATSSIK